MQHLDIQSEQLMAPRTLYHIVCGLAAELADGAVVFQLNVRDIGTAFAAVRAFQLWQVLSVVCHFFLLSLYGRSFITFTATPCTTISSGQMSFILLFSG